MTINRILDECEKRIDYLLFLIKDIDDKMIYASSKEKDKLIRKRAILLHEKISLSDMIRASK